MYTSMSELFRKMLLKEILDSILILDNRNDIFI